MVKDEKKVLLKQRTEHRHKYSTETAEILLALVVLLGVLLSVRDIMYSSRVLKAAMLSGAVILLLLHIIRHSRKFTRYGGFVIFLVGAAGFIVFIVSAANGFLDMVNRLIVLWNVRFGTEGRVFSINGNIAFGAVVLWVFIAAALAALLFTMLHRRMTGCVILLILTSGLFGFIVGRSSMWGSVLCMLYGITGVMVHSLTPSRQVRPRGMITYLITGALCLAVALPTMGYNGSERLARWREDVHARYEKIRYGEDTLPQGNLRKATGLLDGDEGTLEVTMSDPHELYLKGFVGGKYDSTSWQTLEKGVYEGEYEGLTDWLEKEGASPVRQYGTYTRLDQEAAGYKEKSSEVQVQNIGAYRKYIYLPHSVLEWNGDPSKVKKDWQVQSSGFLGAKKYSYKEVKNAANADEVTISDWIQAPETETQKRYVEAESVYHYFVEENYMDIDEQLKSVIDEMFFSEELEDKSDFNEVTGRIRKILRQETRYTQYPAQVPENKDFIRWFLEEEKRGNAVHYASAAVMAYRASGYPARYVEGYHYGKDEAELLKESGEDTIGLTNKNAHAWVEVYVTGAGWMPVEVVPGMYVETYTNQTIEGKPAYQISSRKDEDGIDTEQGGGADSQGTDKEKEKTDVVSLIPAGILMAFYGLFFLYLLLELQRFLRIRSRRRRKNTDYYAREIQGLLFYAGVKGDYTHPLELSDEIAVRLPGIGKNRYERVIALIQKIRFGGKELRKDEEYVVACFISKLRQEVYLSKKFLGKLKLRYKYAVESF